MGAAQSYDFTEIYDGHFDQVYAYVAYRVGGREPALDDIVQDVFVAALKGLPRFQPDRPVLTWLRAIARNKVADHFRSRGTSAPEVLGPADMDRGPARSPEERRHLAVSHVMRRLSSRYADLLEAKYLDGLSVKDIARRGGESEKAVESALSRAREEFRSVFSRLQAMGEIRA